MCNRTLRWAFPPVMQELPVLERRASLLAAAAAESRGAAEEDERADFESLVDDPLLFSKYGASMMEMTREQLEAADRDTLSHAARRRGLATTGRKAELVHRLLCWQVQIRLAFIASRERSEARAAAAMGA